MSAESMTDFVRDLFQRCDYKTLTQNDIRQEYMRHIGVGILNEENKSLLREIVEILVLEMMYNEEKTTFVKDDGTSILIETQLQHMQQVPQQASTEVVLLTSSKTVAPQIIMKDKSAILASDLHVQLEEVCEGGCTWPPVSLQDDMTVAKPVMPCQPEPAQHAPLPAKKIIKEAKVRFVYKCVNKKHSNGKTEPEDGDSAKKFSHLFSSKAKKQSNGKGWVVINLGSNCSTPAKLNVLKSVPKKRPLKSKSKKAKTKETAKKTFRIVESGSESGEEVKKSRTKGKPKKAEKKDAHVRHVEKIARTCGVLPVGRNYKTTFENCMTCKERVEKLIQLLRKAGMTGPITMKNAKEFKLKLEAQELERDLKEKKITVTEGRGHRNVYSVYSRHAYEPKPLRPASPIRRRLSHLKGIVYSDESSSED